jgi:hypothetical protein
MREDHLIMPRTILHVLRCSANHFGIDPMDAQTILNHWKEQYSA